MKKRLLSILLTLSTLAMSATRITPINPAEAIFAPLWDTNLMENPKWAVNHGRLSFSFPGTYFYWDKKTAPSEEADFEIVRNESFSCAGYDHLMFFGRVPTNNTLRITLETDKGTLVKEWHTAAIGSDEYVMPLEDATTVNQITFQLFELPECRSHSGLLLWFGLQNAAKLEEFMAQRKAFASQPLDVFLAPEGTQANFKGRIGLLGTNEMIEKARELYQQHLENGGAPITLPDFEGFTPEESIAECTNYANSSMFARQRDRSRKWMSIPDLIKKGLILKDQKALEVAAKLAIIHGLIPNWDCTFMSEFRDSCWDQRVFAHADVAALIAFALDYTSELMSEAGRQLLYRRLAQYGLGWINFNIWRFTYLFGNNQLSVFSRGRIASYLVLEKASGWNNSRIPPYTDLAFSEAMASITALIHPDGSFMEGPPYFGYTLSSVQPILEMYSNARKKPITEIMPQNLQNLGKFADVFISTDRRGGMVPISSGQGNGRGAMLSTVQFLAICAPDSQWVRLYNNMMKASPNPWVSDILFLDKLDRVPKENPPMPAVAELPIMGMMASHRRVDGKNVKLLLCGGKENSRCHRHNDRGSFVLEYGGDTFAADPGGQSYADEDGHLVKRSDYHNMLTPTNMPDNEPLAVSTADIRPVGTGDETSFHAEFNPQPSSGDFFKVWRRAFDSPNPRSFSITDTYELAPAYTSASFLWITELPFKQVGDNQVRIEGKNADATITFPKELAFSSETLTVRQKEKYNRLRFTSNIPAGSFTIQVEFQDK